MNLQEIFAAILLKLAEMKQKFINRRKLSQNREFVSINQIREESAKKAFNASIKLSKWHFFFKLMTDLTFIISISIIIIVSILILTQKYDYYELIEMRAFRLYGIFGIVCGIVGLFWTHIMLGAKVIVRAAELTTLSITKNNAEIKDLYEHIE